MLIDVQLVRFGITKIGNILFNFLGQGDGEYRQMDTENFGSTSIR